MPSVCCLSRSSYAPEYLAAVRHLTKRLVQSSHESDSAFELKSRVGHSEMLFLDRPLRRSLDVFCVPDRFGMGYNTHMASVFFSDVFSQTSWNGQMITSSSWQGSLVTLTQCHHCQRGVTAWPTAAAALLSLHPTKTFIC